MDDEQLKHLIRESYPFPIAHAHKKVAGMLADDARKLQGIVETAELTVQFLALLALAQVRQDLLDNRLPDLPVSLTLTRPSFGNWCYLLQNVLEAYRPQPERLIVPELLTFYEQEVQQGTSRVHLVESPVLGALRELRNDFHHRRIPERQIAASITQGWEWLKHLLTAVQFLAQYKLVFTQRILLGEGAQQSEYYIHDLTVFNGCFSTFDQERWKSGIHLQPESLVFLRKNRFLTLEPFIIFSDYLKGAPDILLLTDYPEGKPEYLAAQFAERLSPTETVWKQGWQYHRQLRDFFRRLRKEGAEPEPPEPIEEEVAAPIVAPAQTQLTEAPPVAAGLPPLSDQSAQPVQHKSPYKFLDYYDPEDADIFFGRDREILQLEQKFYNSRLLVLHGESGAGKTSLIRAGLIARLHPETYIPVYVRMLQEPLQEVKRELDRQLERTDRLSTTSQVSLVECLRQVTESVSKTVIIVLDQFEEFFLRYSEDLRRQFIQEFAACVHTPRLDVKFLIALRSDYFSNLETFEQAIPQIFTHQLRLERLSEAQALDAVLKPAQRLGIQVDEPMAQIKLLPDLLAEEGGIEPPLLQIVCDALYQNAQNDGRNTIGLADYEAIGDVHGALGKYLETKLRQFGQQQPQARAVLKAFVTTAGTKQAVFLPELAARISSAGLKLADDELQHHYLDKFVNYRLVRVDEVEGRARYELSHDYLAKQIETWIAESEREVTKVLELIDRAYETYRATNVLLERSALQMLKPFEEQIVLPPDKQTFVKRSKIQVKKQQRGLWLKVVAALIAVALVVGGILGYQTYQAYQETLRQKEVAIAERNNAETQRQKAEQQTEIAQKNLQQSRMSEIESLTQTSKALFLAHDELSALLAGIKARKMSQSINLPKPLNDQIRVNLRNILDGIHEENRLEGHTDRVSSIAFSPDGTLLASGSWDNTIKFWNVKDGREIRTLYGHTGRVSSIAFSPDGTILASGIWDGTIKLWKVADGTEIMTLPGPNDTYYFKAVFSLAFSPDGTWLASGGWTDYIKFWNVADGRENKTLPGYAKGVYSLAFSPDGTLLALGGGDKTIELREVSDGRLKKTLRGHTADGVWSVCFSPDGTLLASGSDDKTIKLWQVKDGSEVKTLYGHTSGVYSVSFSPDGTLLASGSRDDAIKLWKLEDGRVLKTFFGVDSVVFSPDGKMIASRSREKTIKLLNTTGSSERMTLPGHTKDVKGVAFSPDGTLVASGSDDETIKIWQVAGGRELRTLHGYDSWGWGGLNVTFSPDGKLLASGGYEIKIWQIVDGRKLTTLEGHTLWISSVSFSSDGTLLASGSLDRTIKLWQVENGQELKTLVGHDLVLSVNFSPDGALLASGFHDGTITLWKIADGNELRSFYGHTDRVWSVTFSPDGTVFVSGSADGTIKLWQVADGRELRTLHGHAGGVYSVSFSPDGTLLVSGSADNTIKVWKVEDGSELRTLRGHSDPVYSVSFSPDGTLLASGSEDKSTKLWDMDAGDPLLRGCEHVEDYLKTNPNVNKADRTVCDEIFQNDAD